jgi:hypothetical protein
MYTEEERKKLKRDYSEDRHELQTGPEDQAHLDSIKKR